MSADDGGKSLSTPGIPDPIKKDLLGLQSLVKFPNARAILVNGQSDFAAAQRMFPQNPVLAWEGGTGALHTYYLGHLESRSTIVWDACPVPPIVREVERQLGVAGINVSTLAIFAPDNPMECLSPAEVEQRRLPRTWILPRLRAYTPVAAVEPASPMPEPSVAPVARPVASVTPITEARTKQQAKAQPNPADDYAPFADDAMARAFTAAHPELRYVARWGKWLAWGDAGWQEDTTLQVYDLARQVCCSIADATRGATPSAVSGAKSAGKVAAVEKMAKSDRAHAASTEQWDADPLALNTPYGLIDLRTGSVRPARIEDYCRRICDANVSYEPAVRWLDFLKFGTNGDDDLVSFLQLWAGYSATGETKEQKFVFIHGPGGAGKGTFVNTVARVLGTYARKIAMDTLVDTGKPRDGGAPSEDIAGLAGARLGYASETEQGRRWNEGRLKEITGEDKMRGRFMAKDSFEFQPQIKLTIMGNHPPGIKTVGNDMIRRTLIVPFEHLPPVPDADLRDKLWAERDQILGWIVTGAVRWQCDGLLVPDSVAKRSAAYFENQDVLGQWMADACENGPACESTIRALYKSYQPYCHAAGEFWLRQGEFKDALLSRPGISVGGYKTAPTITGLRVRVDMTAHDSRFPDN